MKAARFRPVFIIWDAMTVITPPSPCAAVYIRVSTEDQAELSPETQLAEVEKYARQEGITLLRDHIYIDAGISGKKAERRPEFMRMIAAAKEKGCPFQMILLWKYSRFARNQEESIFYKSILRSKCGVDVRSVTEPLIAGPFGSLIERIIEWMDEFYSIRLSQEVKRSMSVNAQRGKLQCAAPFGYRVEDGGLVPQTPEDRLVRQIFEDFLLGKGPFSIAAELNAIGVRTHRGNLFEGRAVEYILRNPVYIGRLRWNPAGHTRRDFRNENLIIAEAGHQPLVSPAVWEKAQRQLDERKAREKPRARPAPELKSWLSGLTRCAACGATLVFVKPHYYKCNNYIRGRCGQSQHIRADLLEEAILSRLAADAEASAPLTYALLRQGSDTDGEQSRTEAALRQVSAKKARLREAYLSGVLELADFAEAKAALDKQEARLRREAEELRARPGTAGQTLPRAIAAALETLRAPEASLERRHNAACAVIESCVLDKSAAALSVTYRFRLPPPPQSASIRGAGR